METWQEAACYIRVSTEDQTEYSPEAQHRALEHYARQHQLTISPEHVYIDAGISGRRAETRPAFMAMIAAAKKRPPPFSVILVHKFDRFARNREDSIVYKSMLRRQCGVQVVSITEHLEDDKMSLILEAMLEAMAEYYSINLGDAGDSPPGRTTDGPTFWLWGEGQQTPASSPGGFCGTGDLPALFSGGGYGIHCPMDPADGDADPPRESPGQPKHSVHSFQPGLRGKAALAWGGRTRRRVDAGTGKAYAAD